MVSKVYVRIPSLRLALLLSLVLLTAGIGPVAAAEDGQAIAQLQSLNKAFTSIAKKVTPSVVTISTKQEVEQTARRRFFNPFFRDPRFREREGEPEERQGLGSGIVITGDGYILTNHHVAGEANEITVTLSDNREFEAELVGSDTDTDVAVIKINTNGLKAATIGNSDRLEIGEWVLAIGAPLGFRLRSTVTAGIVSAIGRNLDIIRDSYGVEDFIQTDAAINPGNSGGALVNLKGEVIGVNTAIATDTGRFVGYGFAIPITLAQKVMDDIITHGRVRRGYLGVSMEPVTAAAADAFGLDRPQGVLINQVFAETAAEAAGLQAGDIVLKIDGQEVNQPNQFSSLIARKHPDDNVSMEVRRKNKTLTLSARLREKPTDLRTASADRPKPGQTEQLGLTIQDITPEIAESIGIEENVEGVIVTHVHRGPARDAGFQDGDIIFHVRQRNIDQDIRSVKDFKTALERLEKGRNAAFSVKRRDFSTFLTIKIPK